MRPNSYAILARAVDEGIAYGWRRAFKYIERPEALTLELERAITAAIEDAVMTSICEVFTFDDDDEKGGGE